MTQENVEILRRGVEAFNRGDEDEWIAIWDPAAELYDFRELPDAPPPYRGRDGVRRWAANVRGVLGDFRMEPDTFTRIGDTVLMDVEVVGVGEQSGVPVKTMVHVLAWMRHGKIIRTRAFLDRVDALEAAGLSE
jgi:ketosteroid isomerase-like protein